jgi:hypothetical protein
VVLPGLQGKGPVRQGKHFCCLEFLLIFFKKKVIGTCGYEQTDFHNAQYLPMGLPRYRSQ